jgi:DNA-binding NarL/FixJ family response regulator
VSGRRVLIVDSDEESRRALSDALALAGHEIVAVATGEEALELSEEERPLLAVVDVLLPMTSGYEVCRALKWRYGVPVILVSGDRTQATDRVAGLLLGADEYLTKPVHPDELRIRASRMLEPARRADVAAANPLTRRELEVMTLMADGLGHAEIAERLVITRRTVSKHVEHILTKLGVNTRAQAVALAIRGGLLDERWPER